MSAVSPTPLFDALVIGAGPAGLSAALQLARSNRQVVVIDAGEGRSSFRQVNHNYLGFPGGVAARDIRALGRKQLEDYPVAYLEDAVESLTQRRGEFEAMLASKRPVRGRTVVLATGVTDDFPRVPSWRAFVGRSLFWCIVCDGYAARGKRVVTLGNDAEAATTSLQFKHYTQSVTLLTNHPECALESTRKAKLARHEVELVVGEIAEFCGEDGVLCNVILRDGRSLDCDLVFSLQGSTPNSKLAAQVGAALDEGGHVRVDEEQHTNVRGLFAAGDLSNRHAHQVATAVHEGLTAATAVHHYLLPRWQQS